MGAELLRCNLKAWQPMAKPRQNQARSKRSMKDTQNKDGVAVFIAAPAAGVTGMWKSRRINVTMPADVLDQIDRYAEREGFTRSGSPRRRRRQGGSKIEEFGLTAIRFRAAARMS